ncbi:ribosomal protein s19 [Diplodia corticola]|uniref:Ribosomal protein s19 n=1 Tax=Diplodia corticola TaxID=236234 RepID=A0A1J9RZ69_9PEZI|nr:ribosomal protein s19 [Diplodia corticola]OJD37971.1 ribosomal protein s19 [Diplodia corticola]
MLPTRALFARSVWKGPNIVPASPSVHMVHRDMKNTAAKQTSDRRKTRSLPIVFAKPGERAPPPIKTQARSAVILPNFVGLKFAIHNGKTYTNIQITEDMVGYKLGEFAA